MLDIDTTDARVISALFMGFSDHVISYCDSRVCNKFRRITMCDTVVWRLLVNDRNNQIFC